jgi:hypothetical protein
VSQKYYGVLQNIFAKAFLFGKMVAILGHPNEFITCLDLLRNSLIQQIKNNEE